MSAGYKILEESLLWLHWIMSKQKGSVGLQSRFALPPELATSWSDVCDGNSAIQIGELPADGSRYSIGLPGSLNIIFSISFIFSLSLSHTHTHTHTHTSYSMLTTAPSGLKLFWTQIGEFLLWLNELRTWLLSMRIGVWSLASLSSSVG